MKSPLPRCRAGRRSRLIPALAAACLAWTSTPVESAPVRDTTPDGRPIVLVFADEFDRFSRWNGRSGTWRTTFGDGTHEGLDRRSLPTNGELQLYVDQDISGPGGSLGLDPFTTRNGILEIRASRAAPAIRPWIRDYPYISGIITTQPSFSQIYGYFEMRAKLPRGKGLWPAFWLLPLDLSWPPEIDVVESIGDPSQVYFASHSTVRDSQGLEARISPDDFHVFAVSWDPRELIWFVDDREVGRQTTARDMHVPMYMLVNLAVGGNWPGSPDHTTEFPATLAVDYVRAYRFVQ